MRWLNILSFASALIAAVPAHAGRGVMKATEFTQMLNRAQLVAHGRQNAQQIQNQMQQMTQLAQQIQNQLRIYDNMLQNTRKLPASIWGNAARDLTQLQSLVQKSQGFAFSLDNLDSLFQQRFPSYSDLQRQQMRGQDFSTSYQNWSDTNRSTISGTLVAAGLTSKQFATEEETMVHLRQQSDNAEGQMQAIQVGHQISAQLVEQMQKLRALIAEQMVMMATLNQGEQVKEDQEKLKNEKFFGRKSGVIFGDETPFKPEW